LAGEGDRHHLLSYLEERFGISENRFDGYLLFKRRRSWWLLKGSPYLAGASQLKVSTVGLRAFSRVGRFVKPSTRMIQMFGHTATKANLHIDEDQLQRLVWGEPIPVDLQLEAGYVILSLRSHVIGLGLLINGLVYPQIHRRELLSLNLISCSLKTVKKG
jgi:NOL1/NOP2/fmu family ribosome biogenesis protein